MILKLSESYKKLMVGVAKSCVCPGGLSFDLCHALPIPPEPFLGLAYPVSPAPWPSSPFADPETSSPPGPSRRLGVGGWCTLGPGQGGSAAPGVRPLPRAGRGSPEMRREPRRPDRISG